MEDQGKFIFILPPLMLSQVNSWNVVYGIENIQHAMNARKNLLFSVSRPQ